MRHYAQRDLEALDVPVPYFSRHMAAMTDEGLFEKGAVAAELGWRDMEIDELKKKVERLRNAAKAVLSQWDEFGSPEDDPAAKQDWDTLRKVLSET